MKPYKLPKQEQSKIQAQIKAAGLTQASIAASMNVSINVVYDWIHGRSGIPAADLVELWKLINRNEILDHVMAKVDSALKAMAKYSNGLRDSGIKAKSLDHAIQELKSAVEIREHGVCADCLGSGDANQFTNGDQIAACGSCEGTGIHGNGGD